MLELGLISLETYTHLYYGLVQAYDTNLEEEALFDSYLLHFLVFLQ